MQPTPPLWRPPHAQCAPLHARTTHTPNHTHTRPHPPRHACSDELRDDDVAQKLNSIKRLGTIAMALGDERTRSELLPYLLDSKPEEDEMMVALAAETAKLVPLVGGPQYAHTLVPLLEELARQDETVVREEAVRSIQVRQPLVFLARAGGGDG